MKSTLLHAFLVLASATAVQAQTAKVTATAERVVASASYRNGTLKDSAIFSWSGGVRSSAVYNEAPAFGYPALVHMSITDFDLVQSWHNATGSLDPFARQLKTYDTYGRLTKMLHQEWEAATGSWQNITQNTYTYSSSSTDKTITTETWDKGSSSWINNYQQSYTSTPSTKERITRQWYSGSWQNEGRSIKTYAGGDPRDSVFQGWNAATLSWFDSTREVYTYSGGHLSDKTLEVFRNAVGPWVGVLRELYTYSGSNLTEQVYDIMDASSWRTMYKVSYSYSGSRLDQQITEAPAATGWNKETRDAYTYSGDQVTRIKRDSWDELTNDWRDFLDYEYLYTPHGNLVYEKQYLSLRSGKFLQAEEDYYYEEFTGIPEQDKPVRNVSLYPNPALNTPVYLDYTSATAAATEIVLSDISGKVLLRIPEAGSIGDHSVMIPAANLAKGIYLVQIYSEGNQLQTWKLLK